VGQGTASNSCGVRSGILTGQAYGGTSSNTVQIGTKIFMSVKSILRSWTMARFVFFISTFHIHTKSLQEFPDEADEFNQAKNQEVRRRDKNNVNVENFDE
jgi:hypothetical protein